MRESGWDENTTDMENTYLNELLSAGRWAEFLNALPFGKTDWTVPGPKALMNIRATAVRIAKRGERKFSIAASAYNELKIYIDVSKPKHTI